MSSTLFTWPLHYHAEVNPNEVLRIQQKDKSQLLHSHEEPVFKLYTSSPEVLTLSLTYEVINTIENNTIYSVQTTSSESEADLSIIIDKTKTFLSQSYTLEVNGEKISLVCNDLVGLQYALLSLKQILIQFICGSGINLPKIFINDYPCVDRRSLLVSFKYFIYSRHEFHEKDIDFIVNSRLNNLLVLCDIFDEDFESGSENDDNLKSNSINNYTLELNEFKALCLKNNINLVPLVLIDAKNEWYQNFCFAKKYFSSDSLIVAIDNHYPSNLYGVTETVPTTVSSHGVSSPSSPSFSSPKASASSVPLSDTMNSSSEALSPVSSSSSSPIDVFWNILYRELADTCFKSVIIAQNFNTTPATSFHIPPLREFKNLQGDCLVYESDYNFIFPACFQHKPIVMMGELVEALMGYTRDYIHMLQSSNDLSSSMNTPSDSDSDLSFSSVSSNTSKDSRRFRHFFTFPIHRDFDYICPDILLKYSISLFAGLAYRGEQLFPVYNAVLPVQLLDLIMIQILPDNPNLSLSCVYTLTPEFKSGLMHLFQWNGTMTPSSSTSGGLTSIPTERSLWQLSLMNPSVFTETQEGGLFVPDVSMVSIPSLDKVLSCYTIYHTFLSTIKFSPASFKMARHRKLLKVGTKYYHSYSKKGLGSDHDDLNNFGKNKFSKIVTQDSCLLSELDELVYTVNTLCTISRSIYMSAYLISSNVSKPFLSNSGLPFLSIQNNAVTTGGQVQPPRRVAVYDNFDMSKPYAHKIHPKNDEIFNMLKSVVHQNILFKNFQSEEHSRIVEAFEYVSYESKGEVVIQQGDLGEFFYIVESGILDVFIESGGLKLKIGRTLSKGDYFGELALMYNTPRAASVITASNNTSLWRISRHTYRMIVTHHNKVTTDEFYELVCNVHILGKRLGNVLSHAEINKVVSTLEVEEFEHDSVIIRQHQTGDYFYIILEGQVDVFQEVKSIDSSARNHYNVVAHPSERNSFLGKKVATLNRGSYFGEKALLADDVRQASCVSVGRVVCLSLSRDDFIAMIGSLQDILEDNSAQNSNQPDEDTQPLKKTNKEIYDSQYHLSISFDDIERLNPLGVGSFGYVQIARHKSGQLYALKSQSKEQITSQNMQAMVLNEVKIMTQLNHPFILKLHAAIQDKTYIYHLLELLPGGDFFTFLQKNGSLDENICRFYSSCVVLALEELHKFKIAYRDLKPENLVMDARGYIKLVDFGLAKQFLSPGGITWTMCGTPDYLAPEVILNKGHNYAVDYWALGIFLYEIRHGFPPFHDKQPMKIYEKVISGKVSFPSTFSKPLEDLILKFLVLNPSKRLGNMKLGFSAIMKHKWYGSFDWQSLLQGLLTAPYTPDLQQFDADLNSFKTPEGINFQSSEKISNDFSYSDWYPQCIPHC